MNHPAFYIVAALVTIIVLYVMISLAYMQRRKKAFLSMQEKLRIGTEVLVGNAIYGKIVSIEADRVRVEIASHLIITADRAAVFVREETAADQNAERGGAHQ